MPVLEPRRFCGPSCREGWQTDMRYGAIYPACRLDDGRIVSWPKAMMQWRECCYCRAPLDE